MSVLRCPTCPPQRHRSHPPHLILTPLQGKCHTHAAPFCILSLHWKKVSLELHGIFYPCTHFVLTSLLSRWAWKGGGLYNPPHLILTPLQGKCHTHTAPFCIPSRHWKKVSLELHGIFSLCTHFVITSLLSR